MEELLLTTPVVEPEKVSNKLRIVSLMMNHDTVGNVALPGALPGLFVITARDNVDKLYTYQYTGQAAMDYIKFINTANFTTKSLHKRILERLVTDGIVPGGGTVTGTPDSPAITTRK